MRQIIFTFMAVLMLAVSAPSAQALTSAEVEAALIIRAAETANTISDIQADLTNPGLTTREIRQLNRQVRRETARLRQIQAFIRRVHRFPPRRLQALVEYFNLPISPS